MSVGLRHVISSEGAFLDFHNGRYDTNAQCTENDGRKQAAMQLIYIDTAPVILSVGRLC